MQSELKPCPFCGGEAVMQEPHWIDGNLCGEAPFCRACGTKTPRYWPKRTGTAIAVWNARVSDAEIARLTEALRRNMADHGRLIWKDEAQSVCPSAAGCFEYGDTVRCGPCAIKLAERAGVEPNMQLPNLPEVSRLSRENERLTEALRLQMEAKHKEAAEAKLWFSKAQEWKDALRAAEEREKALREALAWYGEQARLARLITSEGDAGRHALQDDGGKRARAALKEQPHADA